MDKLESILNLIKEIAPAVVMAICGLLVIKEKRAMIKQQMAEHELAALQAKDASEKKFAGRSDSDVLDSVLGDKDPK